MHFYIRFIFLFVYFLIFIYIFIYIFNYLFVIYLKSLKIKNQILIYLVFYYLFIYMYYIFIVCLYLCVHMFLWMYMHSFLQGWNPPLFWGNPPFLGTSSFWSKFKKLTPSFWEPSKLVHANCMKTLKWRSYISYYTKSIENITVITYYIFRLKSVFPTDSLVRYCL